MSAKADTASLETTVSFWWVDRDELLTLRGLFQLLQEVAILHADQHQLGAGDPTGHGDTWVLNRITAEINRYPRYGDRVRFTTWSSGIRGIKGYREFRLRCGDELLVSASSLWLRVNLATKALVRVPPELADAFPTRADPVFDPELEKLRFEELPADAVVQEIGLRYSDVDINGHVNNAAYFDYLQTALEKAGHSAHPHRIAIHFGREILPTLGCVRFRSQLEGADLRFAISREAETFARGRVGF